MTRQSGVSGWTGRGLAGMAIVALCVVASGHAAQAQSNPFGGGAAASDQVGGIIGWLLTKQSEFYRQLSAAIRAAKSDGTAVWSLLLISFAYGIFHAAGPGHGKAVISSYLIANEEAARRGIALSFASAMLQSLVAVIVIGLGAWLLQVTMKTMCSAERWIEIASYALIAAFGARLAWLKGGGFLRALRTQFAMAPAATPLHVAFAVLHGHAPNDREDRDHHEFVAHAAPEAGGHGSHCADPDHVHDAHCGHSHGPSPDELDGPGGWQRGLAAIFAVGLRPCSGAILVLVFALAQGLFWAGIAATFAMGIGTGITVAAIATLAVSAKGVARRLAAGREGTGALLLRGVEFGAAAVVLLFGVGLLTGYLVAERATCF